MILMKEGKNRKNKKKKDLKNGRKIKGTNRSILKIRN
jgi:hypothetical protein